MSSLKKGYFKAFKYIFYKGKYLHYLRPNKKSEHETLSSSINLGDFRLFKEIKAKRKSTKNQLLFLIWSSHYSGLFRVPLSSYRHSDLLVSSCLFLVICQVHCLSETSYIPLNPFPITMPSFVL